MNRSLGTIVAPQGLDGSVRISLFTQFPERLLAAGRSVGIALHDKVLGPYEVRRWYRHRTGAVVKLDGLHSRDEAERVIGGRLISEGEDPGLPDGHFYVDDILHKPVVDSARHPIGEVIEVLQGKAHDVWVVEGPMGQRLVPAVRAWVDVCSDEIRLKRSLDDA